MVGLLTSPGDGTASYSADVDAGGTVSSQTGTAALSFGSDSNGRFTLTLQGGNSQVGYMVGLNKAFLAGTDSNPSFGTLEPQSSGTFSNSYLDGSFFFGSQPLLSAASSTQAPIIASGFLSFDGEGNLIGTTDSNQAGTVTTNQSINIYSVASNGRVTLVPSEAVLYIVSSNKLVVLYLGQTNFSNPFIEIAQR
jgi:hypothetical protein